MKSERNNRSILSSKLLCLFALAAIFAGCSEKKEVKKVPLPEESFVEQPIESVQTVQAPTKPEGPFQKISKNTENLNKNSVFEANLEIETEFENPYDSKDITLDASISVNNGNKSFTWPLYFVGKQGTISYWSLKCPLIESGVYKCQFILKNKKGMEYSEEFDFQVKDSNLTPFAYQPVKSNPYIFTNANKDAYRGMGANISGGEAADILIGQLKTLSDNGCNIARLNLPNPWLFFNADNAEPQKADNSAKKEADNNKEDVSYAKKYGWYNLDLFNKFEQIFDECKDLNVKLIVSFLDAESFDKSVFDSSYIIKSNMASDEESFFASQAAKDYYKDFLRYMIARFGAKKEFFAWNLFSVLDKYDVKSVDKKFMWIDEMGSYLKEFDVTNRMLLVSSATTTPLDSIWFSESSAIVCLESVNMRNYAFSIYELAKFFNKKYEKGVAFLSVDLQPNKLGHLDLNMIHLHDALWGGFMSACPILPMPADYKTLEKREGFGNFKSLSEFHKKFNVDSSKLQALPLKNVVLASRKGENKLSILPNFGVMHPEIVISEGVNEVEINSEGAIVKNTLSTRLTDNCPVVINLDGGAQGGVLTLELNAIKKSEQPFDIVYLIDDQIVTSKTITPSSIKGETVKDENSEKTLCVEKLSFDIKAGKQKVSIEVKSKDWQNPSYADLVSVEINGIGSIAGVNSVDALGLKEQNKVYAWFKRTATNSWGFFKYRLHTKTIPELKPFNYSIGGFSPNKDCKISWFDTYKGVVTISGVIKTDASGNLNFKVAPFRYDIACCIEEQN